MTEQIILEWIEETCAAYCIPKPFAIVEALQAARATPADQEPVAWMRTYRQFSDHPIDPDPGYLVTSFHQNADFAAKFPDENVPLFAAPQPPQNAADHIVDANEKVDAPTLNKLMWSDMSTASPVEKARRVLDHLSKQDSVYFFEDGFPRTTMMSDVRACLAVLNHLASVEAQSVRDAALEEAAKLAEDEAHRDERGLNIAVGIRELKE